MHVIILSLEEVTLFSGGPPDTEDGRFAGLCLAAQRQLVTGDCSRTPRMGWVIHRGHSLLEVWSLGRPDLSCGEGSHSGLWAASSFCDCMWWEGKGSLSGSYWTGQSSFPRIKSDHLPRLWSPSPITIRIRISTEASAGGEGGAGWPFNLWQ